MTVLLILPPLLNSVYADVESTDNFRPSPAVLAPVLVLPPKLHRIAFVADGLPNYRALFSRNDDDRRLTLFKV